MVHQTTERPAGSDQPWAAAALSEFLNNKASGMPASSWTNPANPNAIPLTGGIPDPDSLPFEELLQATKTVLSREGKQALEYGGAYGFPSLRELVASRVDPQPGLDYTAANVSLVSGSAHGLHNVFDTFVNPGDTIIVEAPAWGGVLRHLRAYQARMEEVSLDDDGIRVDELDDTLGRLAREGRQAKMIYTIPTFQNPMGVTTSLERRKGLIEVARRHRVLILEDDAYGELRFAGDKIPSILSLAGGEGVIRCGTFSKIIATGLRVGWIIGMKEYVDATAGMRFDNGTSPFTSRIIAAYVEAGHHEPHVEKVRGIYKSKCDAMLSALDERCSSLATWTRPEGGFFIWMTLPEGTDPKRLQQAASEEGVQYVGGASFYPNGGGENNVRLCFSYLDEEKLAEAIGRLGRAIERVAR